MGWTFIFSGADIDVKETADRMGIDEDRAYAFQRTPAGIAKNSAFPLPVISSGGQRQIDAYASWSQ